LSGKRRKSQVLWFAASFVAAMVLLAVPFLVGHLTVEAVDHNARRKTELLLDGTADAADGAITMWVHAQARQAAQVASDAGLLAAVVPWLEADAGSRLDRRQLLQVVEPLAGRAGFEGFSVVDLDGRVRVASEAPVGSVHPVVPGWSWARLVGGQVVVSPPQRSLYPVPRAGVLHDGEPVVYAGAPVLDAGGEITGAIVFRIDPTHELFAFLEDLRVLSSGEAYLVDPDHRMVSPSRFARIDADEGLWEPVAVPTHGDAGGQPTRMAAAVVLGQGGHELTPYPDYRGVLVVGSWRWNEALGVGVSSELDAAEAYAGVASARQAARLIALGADLLFLLIAGVLWAARRRERKLQVRNQAIVDLAPVPIVLTTERGVLTDANRAFAEMVGRPDLLTGRALAEVVGAQGVTQGLVPPVGTVESLTPVQAEVSLETPTGRRTYRVVHQRLDEDQTGERAVCTVAADITEQVEAARKLRHFNRELEERVAARTAEVEAVNAARTRFMAVMTHELRTPLHGVLGLLDLALEARGPGRRKALVRRAFDAGKRLRRIVDEVLDFSELDRGELELAHQPFSLSEVLGVLPDLLYGSAASVPPRLHVHVHPEVPEHLVGDGHRLQQVLSNLVGNAVKFTLRGHITVRVEPCAAPDHAHGASWMRVSVVDTGPGFAPELAERLFDPFTQADDQVRGDFGGSGLGLAICRGFVDRMGGRIWAEGRPGDGATFAFDIPIEVAEDAASPRSGLALVIDPDPITQPMVADHLRALGLQVECARAMHDARARLMGLRSPRSGAPVVVCLAAELMARHGDVGLRRLRHALDVRGLGPARVLLLDAPLARGAQAAEPGRGVDVVVSMPALRADLRAAIWPESDTAALPSDQRPQWPGRRVLAVDDNPTNRFIIEAMLRGHGLEVELAEDGEAAVTAVARRDFDLVMLDLHMPRLDGGAAARQIRALGGQVPPLVLVSAEVGQDIVDDGIFDARLPKPVDRPELESLLRALWPIHELTADGATEMEDPDMLVGVDTQDALDRIGGDARLLRWLLERFVARHADTVEEVRGLLERGDVETALSILHQVRGAAGNLGMTEVAEHAAHAEAALRASEPDPGSLHLLDRALDIVKRTLAA